MDGEVACMPDPGPEGLYQSRLMWTTKQHHIEFAANLVSKKFDGSCSYWFGLDNRKREDKWEDRLLNCIVLLKEFSILLSFDA